MVYLLWLRHRASINHLGAGPGCLASPASALSAALCPSGFLRNPPFCHPERSEICSGELGEAVSPKKREPGAVPSG